MLPLGLSPKNKKYLKIQNLADECENAVVSRNQKREKQVKNLHIGK